MPCVACREVVVGTLYHGTRLPTVGLQPLPGPPPPLRVTRPGSTPTDTTIFRYARKLRRLGHGPMSVCEGEGLGYRSRLCVRQAPLSDDQGRDPGRYGAQIWTGKEAG